ncbi:MAG TPA: class I SAM-dependent methyltransferase [Candidatus Acidoferrales bacterium]|nr:class I SAM-dependent methyltransferase [Candidatus Acidoferrales bacterium]
MKSPVVFQSLEDELKPTLKYLRGRVLNAGCGSRDITDFLGKNGAESVEHCDLKSDIPDAIIADLTAIPREDNRYDTIVCNAVLEHVQFPNEVMQELRRVLKPDGTLLLCVPFMQPYHPRPDYRRYSREGMLELARLHQFEVVEIFPVHTLAQTITWIWWSHLDEKHKRFQKALLWLPFYLWGSLSQRTDFSLRDQSNSYQMALKKIGSNGNGRH